MSKLKSCISQSKVAKAQEIHMENKNAVKKNAVEGLSGRLSSFACIFVCSFPVMLAWFLAEGQRQSIAELKNELDQLSRTTIGESHAQAPSKGTAPSVTATTEESLRGD